MKRPIVSVVLAAIAISLAGCSAVPMPLPSESASPTSTAEPTPSDAPADSRDDDADAEAVEPAALIAPRINATCGSLVNSSARERFLGVDDDEVELTYWPLANGSAAELQAGVLSCEWAGPAISDEAMAAISLEILPDAAAEFAAFAPPVSGTEVLGTIGAGSTINCFDYAPVRSCYVHFLDGSAWVNASFTGALPVPATSATDDAEQFAATISAGLAAAGPLAPAYSPPPGFTPAWSSCAVLDAQSAIREVLGSPSLITPEAEFTGAGTLFSEAWQRVNFKSCVWRQADPYSSPAGQLRQFSVLILPGSEWAWAALREAFIDRGAAPVEIAGADDATMLCFDGDNCSVEALVGGSYVNVTMSMDQDRGGAAALAVTAMEFAISRL